MAFSQESAVVRPVDLQTVSAQTPGVEKSHQNRPQQADVDQRAHHTVAQDAQDQKMREAQQSEDPKAAEMRLRGEGRGRQRGRRKAEEETPEPEKETPPPRGKDPNMGNRIDVTI